MALRLSVPPARFGRCDVRFGPRGRSFEDAPVAGGCGIAGLIGGGVVGELALSVPGDNAKDPQV